MEIWDNIKSSVCSFHTFENYFNDQPPVLAFKRDCLNLALINPSLLSADSGNGITHLLDAVCNRWIDKGKTALCISAQSIVYCLKKTKSQIDLQKFQSYLLSFDLLAIDNIQYFYKRSVHYSNFAFDLLKKFIETNKPIIFACSQPLKDFTKSARNKLLFNRIHLKSLSSLNVFRILKHLCEYERTIPENLLYAISNYKGSVQEYINCLISIRFKTKSEGIIIPDISWEELDAMFKIKNYFLKQQFRKYFAASQLEIFGEDTLLKTHYLSILLPLPHMENHKTQSIKKDKLIKNLPDKK